MQNSGAKSKWCRVQGPGVSDRVQISEVSFFHTVQPKRLSPHSLPPFSIDSWWFLLFSGMVWWASRPVIGLNCGQSQSSPPCKHWPGPSIRPAPDLLSIYKCCGGFSPNHCCTMCNCTVTPTHLRTHVPLKCRCYLHMCWKFIVVLLMTITSF